LSKKKEINNKFPRTKSTITIIRLRGDSEQPTLDEAGELNSTSFGYIYK